MKRTIGVIRIPHLSSSPPFSNPTAQVLRILLDAQGTFTQDFDRWQRAVAVFKNPIEQLEH
ncbi:MAG: hypothetical protein ACLQU2_37345 [Candidatus Binataceae bacterium]